MCFKFSQFSAKYRLRKKKLEPKTCSTADTTLTETFNNILRFSNHCRSLCS